MKEQGWTWRWKKQPDQMEPVSVGLPVSGLQMDIMGHMADNSSSQGFSGQSERMGVIEPVSHNPVFNNSAVPSPGIPNYGSTGGDSGFSSIWMSADLVNEDPVILSSNSGHEKPLPVKRKADMGFNSYNFISEQEIFPEKLSVPPGNGFGLSGVMQQPTPQRTVPVPVSPGFQSLLPQSTMSKKMVQENAINGKSYLQRGQPVKKQHTQLQPWSKAKESSELVRSKMRESLTAALALTNSDKNLDTKKDQGNATGTNELPVDSNDPGLSATKGRNTPSGGDEVFSPKELSVTDASQVLPAQFPSYYTNLNGGGTFPEFQYTSMLCDDDSQFSDGFLGKDDLLQGNGLSWALDFDVQMTDGKDAGIGDDLNTTIREANERQEQKTVEILTPEKVAFKIEAELFRLFDGVNKKYKEKGRSLLFNLKDRNNPELRERVMSGELSPERLCSMSAEELASKELSEWRMAKAEELAQMKVLPEVDIRSLVRKTHKGEYQVEIERDYNIVADVSGGASILTRREPKKEDIKSDSPAKASPKAGDGENVTASENQDTPGSLVIPADGADLMQKVMVEELKSPKSLPPVVSLDEFMESLNSEPPFEKLSSDADQTAGDPQEKLNASTKSRRASVKDAPPKGSDATKHHETKTAKRSRESPTQKAVSNSSAEEVQYAWEGVLQFHNSSSVRVRGLYQSGEKTATKPWPSSLDIKGRVRLGAFEKFVQDLPMSRTRAVMVLKLELKDKASKSQLTSLSEAIAAYNAEERLGYAEPMNGVEIYLCPWTPRVAEMVKHYVPKESADSLSIEDGLIGVVVWKRAGKTSSSSKQMISRKPTSHHKHSSSSRKQGVVHHHVRSQDSKVKNATTLKSGAPSSSVLSNVVARSKPEPEREDEDDAPPGFGPLSGKGGAADDDLPEFTFTGSMNPSLPRIPVDPVDKVRELIQKYGHSGGSSISNGRMMSSLDDRSRVGSGFEPWKEEEDDDDDIPEWQPQAPPHLQMQQSPYTTVALPPVTVEQQQQQQWVHRVAPPPPPHGARWRPY